MPSSNPQAVHAQNADELQVQLAALAIWNALEVQLVDGPPPQGSIVFDDANSIRRTITFDMGIIDRQTASHLITSMGKMVYRGADSASATGVTRYIYGRIGS